MRVVDQVEVGDLVGAGLESEKIHDLERDERSIADCPIVLKVSPRNGDSTLPPGANRLLTVT